MAGPTLTASSRSSLLVFRAMRDGRMTLTPRQRFGIADVRDVSTLHISAMGAPEAAGRRYLALADGPSVTFLAVAQILRENLGDLAKRVPTQETPGDALPDLVIHNDRAKRELGFRPRPAGSGRVHVLVEPQAGQGPFLLPAGTLLNAGRDAAGKEVHYRTDDALVVTPAQVRECRSLFLRRTFVGLDDVRRNPDALLAFIAPRVPVWQHEPSAADKSFQALLEVALGGAGLSLLPRPRHGGRDDPGG